MNFGLKFLNLIYNSINETNNPTLKETFFNTLHLYFKYISTIERKKEDKKDQEDVTLENINIQHTQKENIKKIEDIYNFNQILNDIHNFLSKNKKLIPKKKLQPQTFFTENLDNISTLLAFLLIHPNHYKKNINTYTIYLHLIHYILYSIYTYNPTFYPALNHPAINTLKTYLKSHSQYILNNIPNTLNYHKIPYNLLDILLFATFNVIPIEKLISPNNQNHLQFTIDKINALYPDIHTHIIKILRFIIPFLSKKELINYISITLTLNIHPLYHQSTLNSPFILTLLNPPHDKPFINNLFNLDQFPQNIKSYLAPNLTQENLNQFVTSKILHTLYNIYTTQLKTLNQNQLENQQQNQLQNQSQNQPQYQTQYQQNTQPPQSELTIHNIKHLFLPNLTISISKEILLKLHQNYPDLLPTLNQFLNQSLSKTKSKPKSKSKQTLIPQLNPNTITLISTISSIKNKQKKLEKSNKPNAKNK